MADRMEFPNTMKEFIENFSFKDSEEVYTNGAELIPVFRVEQGFEHYAKEIRVKAIDEFAEAIKKQALWIQQYTNAFGNTANVIREKVNQIAEQMKGDKNDI